MSQPLFTGELRSRPAFQGCIKLITSRSPRRVWFNLRKKSASDVGSKKLPATHSQLYFFLRFKVSLMFLLEPSALARGPYGERFETKGVLKFKRSGRTVSMLDRLWR